MKIPDLLVRLLFVPACVSCGTRLPLSHANGVLCEECRTRYEDEKEVSCPVCASVLSQCTCLPPSMTKTAARRMVKLFRYRPGGEDVSASLIFALKHNATVDLLRFFAAELATPLSPLLEGKDTVIVYPPRGKNSLHRDGYDHAEKLAKELGRALSVPVLPAFSRRFSGQQKKLSRAARLAAASGYTLRKDICLKGKHVIVLDDISTTGATLLALSRLLYKAGVRDITLAVIAVTPERV